MRFPLRILLDLGPWFAFSLCMQLTPEPLLGLLLLLFGTTEVVLNRRELKGGNPLTWATLIVLAFLAVNGVTNALPWLTSRRNAALLCYVSFAVTATVSVLLRRPFTGCRARRQVPEELWRHPLFIRINQVVSLAWATAFAVNAAVVRCFTAAPLTTLLLCYAVLAGAALFSEWYPRHFRRTAAASAPRA